MLVLRILIIKGFMKKQSIFFIFVFLFLVSIVNVSAVILTENTSNTIQTFAVADDVLRGVNITPNYDFILTKMYLAYGSNCSETYIFNSLGVMIANATVTNTSGWLNSDYNIVLSRGQTYYLGANGNGGNCNMYQGTGGAPGTRTAFNLTSGWYGSAMPGTITGDTYTRSIYNLTTNSNLTFSTFFQFTSPSESGTTKYLPSNYLLINVTTNISNFVNMTLNVYNSTGLIYSNLTTSNASYWNITLPFTNDTYYYNITARNTTNSSIDSSTFTNYIRFASLNVSVFSYNGSVTPAFNYSLYDYTSGLSSNGSSSSNSVILDVVIGRSYNLTVSGSSIATTSSVFNINSSLSYLNVTSYPYNSIRISSFLESDNSILNINASILFFGNSSSFTYVLNGTNYNYFPIPSDTYTITVTSSGYATRSYYVTVANASTQSLNIYMLPSNSSSIIGFYTKDLSDNIISDSLIQIQQLVNTSYIGVTQGVTDGNGFLTLTLQEGKTYRLSISANGFIFAPINFVPYLSNSPYTFKLSSNSSFEFHTLTDYLSYSYSPVSQELNQSLNVFSLTTYSPDGYVLYTFINCSGNSSNVTGSTSITTVSVSLNVPEGTTASCLYAFDVVDYGYYSFTVDYRRLSNSSTSIKASAKYVKDHTSQIWLTLFAFIIMCLIAIGIRSKFPDTRITGVIFCVGTIFFVGIGWIDLVSGGVSATIGLLLLYVGSR